MRPDASKVIETPPGTTLFDVPWAAYTALRGLPANDRVRMTYHDGTLILRETWRTSDEPGTALYDVPWHLYRSLRELPANDRVRMSYLDGTLILMSPEYVHEDRSTNLAILIRNVAIGLGIDIKSAGSTTLGTKGEGDSRGKAKEPDSSFWIGANALAMRGKKTLDLEVDAPPDLALEIENKVDSSIALPIYEKLGVPEVWRYDVRRGTLWFGRLVAGAYESIGRSLHFPRLTPDLVMEALNAFDDGAMSETAWAVWLMEWARRLPEPPAPQ